MKAMQAQRPDSGEVVRDACIQELATSEARLRERLADLESENAAVRALAESLADELHVMTERERNAEQDRDSYRTITRQLLTALHLAYADPQAWARHVAREHKVLVAVAAEMIAHLAEQDRLQAA